MLYEVLASLRLFDLFRAGEQRFEIAVLVDQLGRRLDADTGHTRDIVDRISCKRLNLNHFLRTDAEPFDDLVVSDSAVLHFVEHPDPVVDQLHQILVGRNDGDVRARLDRLAGVGRDDVVGFETLDLDRVQVEGLARLADQRELGDQFFRRIWPVTFIFGIDVVTEVSPRRVEDDGDVIRIRVAQQLHQHAGEAEDGVHRRSVRPVQRPDGVERAEDKAGTIDEIEMFQWGVGHADYPSAAGTRRYPLLRPGGPSWLTGT